jgi:hypothetical protein
VVVVAVYTSSQDLAALLDGLVVHALRKLEALDAKQGRDAGVQIEEREEDLPHSASNATQPNAR